MCVGLSARVINVHDDMALIDASGAKTTVSAAMLDDLEPGDYVMVHAGIAIAKITDDENSESDKLINNAIAEPANELINTAL